MHVLATGATEYRQYASYMTETARGNVYKINIWWFFKRFIFFSSVTGGLLTNFISFTFSYISIQIKVISFTEQKAY